MKNEEDLNMPENTDKKTLLSDVVNIVYVTAENAAFEVRNGFLALKIKLKPEPKPLGEEADGDDKNKNEGENKDGKEEKTEKKEAEIPDENGLVLRDFPRVFLHRAFPFENPYEYISVLNGDNREIGFIRTLDELRAEDIPLVKDELERKYYTPTVTKILSMNERFGFSYWTVETEAGERTFTMQDTYRSIHRVSGTHIFLNDVDGNRYDIPDVEALDRKSYRKIELYL